MDSGSAQPMPMTPPSKITLAGRIERVTYYNRENHFTIARLRTDENQRTITIKGDHAGTVDR